MSQITIVFLSLSLLSLICSVLAELACSSTPFQNAAAAEYINQFQYSHLTICHSHKSLHFSTLIGGLNSMMLSVQVMFWIVIAEQIFYYFLSV